MDELLLSRVSVLLAALSVCVACETKDGSTTPELATTQGAAGEPAAGDKAEHQCADHAEGACAGKESPPAVAEGAQPTLQKLSVKPGDFAEVNFVLVAGSSVSAAYATDGAPTKWNVHSHGADDQLVIHAQGSDAKGKLEFAAPADGMFSFLWVNEGDADVEVEIKVLLSEGARIHSWIPAAN